MANFTYDAPDFFDFARDLVNEDAKKAEAFFETEHKNHNGVQALDSIKFIDDSERDLEQDFYTPLKQTPEPANAEKCLRNRLRKSLSMSNLPTDCSQASKPSDDLSTISDAMENLQVSACINKKPVKLCDPTRNKKSHGMTTRINAPVLNLRSRSISRDHLDKLAQPKRKNMSHEDLQVKKYVSMAEAISQFQQKTPKRFHSKSKINSIPTVKQCGPIPNTVPQSPALATKQRARPIYFISREEQELKEYEEAQKYKIKASTINPKILNGPTQLKTILKKPPTQPEPFNLTELPIKKVPTSPKVPQFEFHAKPVPKSVLEPPKPIIKNSLYTHPQTPKLMKRYPRVEPAKNETIIEKGPFKPVRTKLVPFSFEQRDKDVFKKREQLVNEVLEEEKKAREFHARPLPKSIFRSPQAKNTTLRYQKRQKSDGSLYKSADMMSETLNLTSTFKARPAKVLQMKPFEPKKDDQHNIEISEFQLTTQQRAKEREEFELKKKQKEQKIAEMMKQNEEEMLRREREEMLRLRKEAEHKAQPIRHYKEVKPVPTKKLTAPVSPQFGYDKNKKKEHLYNNKENSLNNSNSNVL